MTPLNPKSSSYDYVLAIQGLLNPGNMLAGARRFLKPFVGL